MVNEINKKFCPDCYSRKKANIDICIWFGALLLAIAFIPNNFWFLVALAVIHIFVGIGFYSATNDYYNKHKGDLK